VQGTSVLKPLVGKDNDGPSDATIIQPILNSDKGLIIANGINPCYGEIDPYWMAASAIDEAIRQIISVGGDLSRIALLDNFCWGNVQQPEILGALVRASQACYDTAKIYQTPFVSGKDSLYNEFEYEGKVISIPHTLLISAISVMKDIKHAISMDFKCAGDLIYIAGITHNELGGSAYLRINDYIGNSVPQVNSKQGKELMDRLSTATKKGLVRSCHDCSEGGIGVASAEMAFAGGLGATIDLKMVPLSEPIDRDDFILFSESNTRFLVEVAPGNQEKFEDTMNGSYYAIIGQVNNSHNLEVLGLNDKPVLIKSLSELKEAWQRPLRW
jgi:phosphoribosylformylglycinamidine synthase